jgi:hypothetical protein
MPIVRQYISGIWTFLAGIATAATPLVIYVYKKKWDGIVQAYYMEYSIYG